MNRSLGSLFVALAGSALAFAVSRLAGFTSGIDAALPFWVLLAGLAGVIATSERASQSIALAIPLMLGAAIAIPDDRARHFAYGIVLAAALALALADLAREGEIARGRAIGFAMLVIGTRAFPFEASAMGALLLIAIGTGTLIVSGCHPERSEGSGWGTRETQQRESAEGPTLRNVTTKFDSFADNGSASIPTLPPRSLATLGMTSRSDLGLSPFLFILAIALATPGAPWDAALIPLTLALGFFAVRGSGRPQAAPAVAALALGLVVGKWMAAAVAVILAAGFLGRAMQRNPFRAWWPFVSGALLLALAFFARPHPALLLLLIALLVVSMQYRATAVSAVAGALLFCALALSAWSGAAAASFPLFADRELWIPFALATLVAAVWCGRPARLRVAEALAASAFAAASFVVLIFFLPKEPHHAEPVVTSIAPGDSFVLEPPLARRAIDVVISGANVSGLARGTLLGRLDVVDAAGRAFARPIRVGDVADWGAFREGDLFRTRNPLPRHSGWTIAGEGRESALRGEGRLRVRLDQPVDRMVVHAEGSLPAGARLQVERMEVPPE